MISVINFGRINSAAKKIFHGYKEKYERKFLRFAGCLVKLEHFQKIFKTSVDSAYKYL